MSDGKTLLGLKWAIGIIAFIVWVVVVRNVITDGGIPYDEDGEMMLSTGKQWVMMIWTIAVVIGAVKIYGWLTKK